MAGKAFRKPSIKQILGDPKSKGEACFSAPILQAPLCRAPEELSLNASSPNNPHSTVPSLRHSCRKVGTFRQQDQFHCQQPGSHLSIPGSPKASPAPSPTKRDQSSNSTHDFGLRQVFPKLCCTRIAWGGFKNPDVQLAASNKSNENVWK